MFLFVSWKTYTITLATPSGWNLLDDFSDGTVAAGNGTGSVHNAVYWRDWQSGDGNPSLNWSAAPTEAHAVIMLWQKGGAEQWGTPAAVHAAISAADPWSATGPSGTNVPDGSVVMNLVGLRDDSTTIGRGATTGINDDGGLITWNGDYVESPATHFNSTTGQDMSGDLGHRFVTTGHSSVALTSAGDPVAAETGTSTWIIQALATAQTIEPALLTQTLAGVAPTQVAQTVAPLGALDWPIDRIDPTQVKQSVFEPSLISQPISGVTPEIVGGGATQTVEPALLEQLAAVLAPEVDQRVDPGLVSQLAAVLAPDVDQEVEPGLISQPIAEITPSAVTQAVALALLEQLLATNAPTVISAQFVTPGLISQPIAEITPDVEQKVEPALVSQPLAGIAPAAVTQSVSAVLISQLVAPISPAMIAQAVQPALLTQLLAAVEPAIAQEQEIFPGLVSQLAAPLEPIISQAGGAQTVQPGLLSQLLQANAPVVTQQLQAVLLSELVSPIAPASISQSVTPELLSSLLAPLSPTVAQTLAPGTIAQALTVLDLSGIALELRPGLIAQLVALLEPEILGGAGIVVAGHPSVASAVTIYAVTRTGVSELAGSSEIVTVAIATSELEE